MGSGVEVGVNVIVAAAVGVKVAEGEVGGWDGEGVRVGDSVAAGAAPQAENTTARSAKTIDCWIRAEKFFVKNAVLGSRINCAHDFPAAAGDGFVFRGRA